MEKKIFKNRLHQSELEKQRPDVFQIYVNLYISVIYNVRQSLFCVMWPRFCQ